MKQFVAIAGNIGVGKSTLSKRLASKLGFQLYLEPDTTNPYLADFYNDMNLWGFHCQTFFLAHRLGEHAKLISSDISVIQDRSIYENAEIFARNLYEQRILQERDWKTYQQIYKTLVEMLPAPNLVIYLRASVPTLLERIKNRGKNYERAMQPEYLARLNELYDRWAESFTLSPILKVETDNINFVTDDLALEKLTQDIIKFLPHQPLPFGNQSINVLTR